MTLTYPWMTEALKAAQRAFDNGEIPVGAVLVYQNKPLVVTHNLVEHFHDATAHAELLAIREACKLLGSKYLSKCDLYVTLEPCLMCAGAIAHTKIRKIVYGAYDPKGGAIDHGPKFFNQPTCHHHPEIISGVEESKCQHLLKDFFKDKR